MSQSLASDKANIMLFPSLIPLRGSYNALLKAHNCFGLSYDVRPGNIRFTCSLLVSAPPHTYYASPPPKISLHIIIFQQQRNVGFLFLLVEEP